MQTIKKDNIVDDFHGTRVADPYRWLEDPSSEETIEWGKSWGEQCDTYFHRLEQRKLTSNV